MVFRSWVRPWMIWAIGYPCALIDRVIQAHQWAVVDVAAFVSEHEKQREADQ